MESGVPAEVIRRYAHSGGDLVALLAEQIPPRRRPVIAQTGRVLPLQRDDVRPHVAGVAVQFHCRLLQIHTVIITEQAVAAKPLYSRAGCDVLQVHIGAVGLLPVALQRRGDERGSMGLGARCLPVSILQQLPAVREVPHQRPDQLLLTLGGGAVVRHQLYAVPCPDVAQVSAATYAAFAAALDVRAFQNQLGHQSSST